METPDEPIISVEFEVFGKVQGVYFTKFCREKCDKLSIGGWVKNSKKGTIVGKIQGSKENVDKMVTWLSTEGSPGCKIDHCDFTNWEILAKRDFKNFTIRF